MRVFPALWTKNNTPRMKVWKWQTMGRCFGGAPCISIMPPPPREREPAHLMNSLIRHSQIDRSMRLAGQDSLNSTCECVSAVTAPPKTHSRQTASLSLSLSGAALCHITSSQRTRAPFACHYRDGNNWLKVTCRELLGRSHSSLPAGFVCLCVRVGWIFKARLI